MQVLMKAKKPIIFAKQKPYEYIIFYMLIQTPQEWLLNADDLFGRQRIVRRVGYVLMVQPVGHHKDVKIRSNHLNQVQLN